MGEEIKQISITFFFWASFLISLFSLHRYWAVTHPHYIHSRTSSTIYVLISLVWVMSIIVSLAPLFGWKDRNWEERVREGECMVGNIVYNVGRL